MSMTFTESTLLTRYDFTHLMNSLWYRLSVDLEDRIHDGKL